MPRTFFPYGIKVPGALGATAGGGLVSVADSGNALTALAATLTTSDLGMIAVTRDNGSIYVWWDDGVTGPSFQRVYQGTDTLLVATSALVPVVANTTSDGYLIVPGNNRAILTRFSLVATVAPASTGGTILGALGAGALFATSLLAAGPDLETLVAGAPAVQTLTATTADLNLVSGVPVRFRITSNNADAVGGPVYAMAEWTLVPSV